MYLLLILLFAVTFAEAAQPNVLLITIDTLRADRLGCYGYKQAQTPNLDALAANALFFENVVAPAPLTLPSHTSLMTGRYPYKHGIRDNAGVVPSAEITIAEKLKSAGYHTYAFVGGFPLDSRFGLDQGFDYYDDRFPLKRDFRSERDAKAVVDAIRSVKLAEPYFLWAHFYDPHAPYLHGGYDQEIAFVDQQTGVLLEMIDRDKTIVVVAGDHGESLGEHGEWTHRIFVYDSTMRVPFWLSGPSVQPARIKQQVRLIDFAPTLLAILGQPPLPEADGSVLPANAGEPAIVESMFPQLQLGWSALAGLRTERWKYIRAPKPELYDLRNDPGERKNVFDKMMQIGKQLDAKLPTTVNHRSATEMTAEIAEQLASLGYVSGGSSQAGSNVDPKDRIDVWNQIEKAVDLEKSKPEEAIQVLENARKMDRTNPMVLVILAEKYAETNRLNQAQTLLESVIRRDPANTLAQHRLALVFLKQGYAERSLKLTESILTAEPNNTNALLLAARAYLAVKNHSGAIGMLRRAAEVDPDDLDTHSDLANAYLEYGQNANARTEFESILKQDPVNVQALNGLATISFMEDDLAQSEAFLKKANRANPQDAQTMLNLALLYSRQGRTPEATSLYQAVLKLPQLLPQWKNEAERRLKELNQP